MPTAQKEQMVTELQESLAKLQSAVLVDFGGLSMEKQEKIRNQLREANVEFKVIKNTLLRLALKKAGYDFVPMDVLVGQNAIAIGYEDVVSTPKILLNLAKEFDELKIKLGFLSDRLLDSSEVERLASIPGREQLYAQIVGGLSSPLVGLLNVMQGNASALVRVLNAYQRKKAS